ncbi:MAG: hypothetical protein AAF387_21270, partial [Pseudomonadota bacterium]
MTANLRSATTRLRIEDVRDLAFESQVAELYEHSLPYHNFGHVQDTIRSAAEIVDRCHEEG